MTTTTPRHRALPIVRTLRPRAAVALVAVVMLATLAVLQHPAYNSAKGIATVDGPLGAAVIDHIGYISQTGPWECRIDATHLGCTYNP